MSQQETKHGINKKHKRRFNTQQSAMHGHWSVEHFAAGVSWTMTQSYQSDGSAPDMRQLHMCAQLTLASITTSLKPYCPCT